MGIAAALAPQKALTVTAATTAAVASDTQAAPVTASPHSHPQSCGKSLMALRVCLRLTRFTTLLDEGGGTF
jgi:hypothetical protein